MHKWVLYKTEHHCYVLHYCGGSFSTSHAFSQYVLFPPLFPRSSFLVPGNWLSMLPFPVTITHTGHKAGMPQNVFLFYEMAFFKCVIKALTNKRNFSPEKRNVKHARLERL